MRGKNVCLRKEIKMDITDLYVGRKVHYQSKHNEDEWKNGIVKEARSGRNDGVWVVYHCDGKWDRFMDHTSAFTDLEDIKLGWRQSWSKGVTSPVYQGGKGGIK